MIGPADALVIGAGPAGLMAAEELARAGWPVVIAEAKPSAARKFLMAGKSGLNITKAEALPGFTDAYAEASGWLAPMLADFGPDQVQDWMRGLGVAAFTGSSGRVFPVGMKASPLLRAWLARLGGMGARLLTRWRWTGFDGAAFRFDTPGGVVVARPRVTVLALGGASWARLGSDGAWAPWLVAQGVEVAPFRPANMGFAVDWSAHMAPHIGAAVKGVRLTAGAAASRGEFVISARGIEGGGVYALSRALRDGARLAVDLLPDWPAGRPAPARGKRSVTEHLRKGFGLSAAKVALVLECARPIPTDSEALLAVLRALPLPVAGSLPMDEAISTAGGIARAALDDGLQIRVLPGVFAAGEMLDWEAPTGGYLLTACLATGRWAGRAAALHMAVGGALPHPSGA